MRCATGRSSPSACAKSASNWAVRSSVYVVRVDGHAVARTREMFVEEEEVRVGFKGERLLVRGSEGRGVMALAILKEPA